MRNTICIILGLGMSFGSLAQDGSWYYTHEMTTPEVVKFEPQKRMVYTVKNTLDVERKNCPVVIHRDEFPIPDIHEMWITIVDPSLPSYEGPDETVLSIYGGHQLRAEVHGHAIFHQLDDLDKDGIWDELFFQTDLKPKEEKLIYIYLGENIQGWNKHATHANVGSYCRHQMPFWESENVGWKIWFANCVDVFAKRKPQLIAQHLYMENLDGYGVAEINQEWGSDIQGVAGTMGGGAICLFEHPDHPDSISLPRFTPTQAKLAPESSLWNAGQISDTRYAYEVVVNGPLRSMIKIKTMNWKSGSGTYALEQYYTVYAEQSYSTCQVVYSDFSPLKSGVKMGCGIRKKPGEEALFQKGGVLISSGPEQIKDPEKIDERADWFVPFIGKALVVKDQYQPEYQFTPNSGGNHTFKVSPDVNNSFEYMLFAAWSEGAVYNTQKDFEAYVQQSAMEYDHPLEIDFVKVEKKGSGDAYSETWKIDNLELIGGHKVSVIGDPEVLITDMGKAVKFDGDGDLLLVDFNPIGDAAAFTVEVVFKPNASYPENIAPRFIHIQDPEGYPCGT